MASKKKNGIMIETNKNFLFFMKHLPLQFVASKYVDSGHCIFINTSLKIFCITDDYRPSNALLVKPSHVNELTVFKHKNA